MKKIDLLKTPINKLPPKIKVEDRTYTLYVDEDTNYHYYQDNACKYFMFKISCLEELNEEVEIIEDTPKEDTMECRYKYMEKVRNYKPKPSYLQPKEDKKIKKLEVYDDSIEWCCNGKAITDTEKDIIDKLDEIIDKINGE